MKRTTATALATASMLSLALLGSAVAHSNDGATDRPGPSPTSTTLEQRRSVDPVDADDGAAGDADADIAAEPLEAPSSPAADQRAAAGAFTADTPAPSYNPPAPAEPVHEVLPGAGMPPGSSGQSDPIGELGDDHPIPAGFDLVAPPKPQGTTTGLSGPTGLAVAPSCSHQCISSGRAYPRGFGAELVVETTVPAQLFISAIADHDGDGDYEDTHFETTPHRVKKHTWVLDHLEPGATYHAMVAATDEHGHTSYAWGEFTTLSQRDVFVEFGDMTITSGPNNITATFWQLGLNGPLKYVTPGQQGILLYKDVARIAELDFWVQRQWDCEIYEAWTPNPAIPQGHHNPACLAWNSTSVEIDLDTKPAGKTRWTSTTVQSTLKPSSGEGNALPPGYGDPYWFNFEVPVTLHVSYK